MKKLLAILLCILLVISTVTGAYAIEYGNDVDINCGDELGEDSNEHTTVLIEANNKGVFGGYLTNSDGSYTANAYPKSTFDGWYDKTGALITTNPTVTPEALGEYYAARFTTENLINDSGFENYTSGQKIYDGSNSAKQKWTVHNGTSAAPLAASWANLFASDTYSKTGNISSKMQPPWQLISTDVKLAPNTLYYIGFDWLYTTKVAGTAITNLNYGLFVPDSSNKMVAMEAGSTTSITSNNIAVATWNKTGFVFETGDTVPNNVVFGYTYKVDNPDSSVSTDDENNTQLYMDDIMIIPTEKFDITLDATNVATIAPVNGSENGFAVKGEPYSFTVITEPDITTPAVSVAGEALTADEKGVYSFIPTANSTIKIDCGAADEGKPAHGKDYEGRDLTKYNADVYLKNIWEGDTVYHETAMFMTGKDTVKLIYPVDEVISLRSYGLDVTYIKGVDFEITEDGCIKRLAGSRIPVYEGELTTNVKPDVNAFLLRGSTDTWLKSIGDATHAKTAVAITYKHSKTFADGYQPAAPESQRDALNNTIAKLENGEKVNIVLYGDSISGGWSSSGLNHQVYDNENNLATYTMNVAPYAPPFYDMILGKLNELYPGQINFKNLALGGKSSPWGAEKIAERLALWTDENGNQVVPDLIMIGFGVNDRSGDRTADSFKANMKAIVDNARTASGNANMEVLYFSPFIPNQLTDEWDIELLLDYEDVLSELADADKNIGLVKLTSIFKEVIKCKAPEDYISSYWNHGNDFTARIYAIGILAAMLSDKAVAEFTPGDVNNDGEVNLEDLVALAQNVAGWDTEVNTAALDVNGDEEVNLDDVTRLAQHLAGWDVEISKKPYNP